LAVVGWYPRPPFFRPEKIASKALLRIWRSPELREERLQVDRLVEIPLLLQVPHPVLGLFRVAARGEEKLVPDALQVEVGEKPLDQLGIEMEVPVPHGTILSRKRKRGGSPLPAGCGALPAERQLQSTW